MLGAAALREVAEFLAGQTLSVDVETVSFAQHFPRYVSLSVYTGGISHVLCRKQFSQADFSKTLRELGLTPSAVGPICISLLTSLKVIVTYRCLLLRSYLVTIITDCS
jgi:hypothetical protein